MPIHTKDGEILLKNGAIRDGSSEACCCPLPLPCNCAPNNPSCGALFAVVDGEAYEIGTAAFLTGPIICENGSFGSSGERLNLHLSGSSCEERDGKVFLIVGVWIVWRQRSGTNCRGACGKFFLYELEICTAQDLCGTQEYTLTDSGDLTFSAPGGFNFSKCPDCIDAITQSVCECEYTECNNISQPSYVGHNPLP
jgi:hypothetical protein